MTIIRFTLIETRKIRSKLISGIKIQLSAMSWACKGNLTKVCEYYKIALLPNTTEYGCLSIELQNS